MSQSVLLPDTFSRSVRLVTNQLAPRSQRIYEQDISTFANWMIAHSYTPESLDEEAMAAYRFYLQETYKPATAKRMFSVTNRLLSDQVKRGILTANPLAGIRSFRAEDETTHVALTKQQAKTLLSAIDTTTSKGTRDYAVLSLLIRTGIRRFECSALTIGSFAVEQGHTIIAIHGKGNKRRIVKVPVEVKRHIEAYLQSAGRSSAPLDAPLFVGYLKGDHPTERRMGEKAIERLVKDYGSRLGIPQLSPHGLRASFITLAIEGGATLTQTQYAAGHADPRTTERYQKRKLNLDNNAVDYIRL